MSPWLNWRSSHAKAYCILLDGILWLPWNPDKLTEIIIRWEQIESRHLEIQTQHSAITVKAIRAPLLEPAPGQGWEADTFSTLMMIAEVFLFQKAYSQSF